jgi:hypothetical protein
MRPATTQWKITSLAIIVKGVSRETMVQEASLSAVDQGFDARRRGSSSTTALMPVRSCNWDLAGREGFLERRDTT